MTENKFKEVAFELAEKADIKMYENQYGEAIELYTQASNLFPTLEDVYARRGFCYRLLDEYDLALEDFKVALYYKPSIANLYCEQGKCQYGLKQYTSAIENYNMALQLKPKSAHFFLVRGQAKVQLEKMEEAFEDFNQGLDLDPTDAALRYERGECYLASGKSDLALIDYKASVKYFPKLYLAYARIGICESEAGRYQDALKNFNKALELDPSMLFTYYDRAECYSALGKFMKACKDITYFIKECEAIHSDDEMLSYPYARRSYYNVKLDKPEAALRDINWALKLENKYLYYYYRANCYSKEKKYDLAIKDLKTSLEMKPDFFYACCELDEVFMQASKYQEGLDFFNQKIENARDASSYYSRRGCYYLKLNDFPKAYEDFNKALSSSPYDRRAVEGLKELESKGYKHFFDIDSTL